MPPEVFACLERLSARGTRERTVGGMDSLVEPDGGRVLEALAADTTLTLIQIAVPVQIVLLEVYPQLKSDVTFLTAERSLLSATIIAEFLVITARWRRGKVITRWSRLTYVEPG